MPPVSRPVVAAARDRLLDVFGARLDSTYLYGSIPRGTARVGRSDPDMVVVLCEEPADADGRRPSPRRGRRQGVPRDRRVGTLLYSRARVLSELERYDIGWFVACLRTPLLGEDLAEFLPRYRPDSRLARKTNGDLAGYQNGNRDQD